MSTQLAHAIVRRPTGRLLVALAVSATTLLGTSQTAHATWRAPGPPSGFHCGDYVNAPRNPPLWIQSCVAIHNTPSGAYVQGVLQVTNTGQRPVGPSGSVDLYLDGQPYRHDDCGRTVIGGQKEMWCYGKTMRIAGNGREVRANGWAWFGAILPDSVWSAGGRT